MIPLSPITFTVQHTSDTINCFQCYIFLFITNMTSPKLSNPQHVIHLNQAQRGLGHAGSKTNHKPGISQFNTKQDILQTRAPRNGSPESLPNNPQRKVNSIYQHIHTPHPSSHLSNPLNAPRSQELLRNYPYPYPSITIQTPIQYC